MRVRDAEIGQFKSGFAHTTASGAPAPSPYLGPPAPALHPGRLHPSPRTRIPPTPSGGSYRPAAAVVRAARARWGRPRPVMWTGPRRRSPRRGPQRWRAKSWQRRRRSCRSKARRQNDEPKSLPPSETNTRSAARRGLGAPVSPARRPAAVAWSGGPPRERSG